MTKFKTPKPLNTLLNKLSEQQGSETIQLSPKTQLNVDEDDIDEFVQILTQITNETNQLNESIFRG